MSGTDRIEFNNLERALSSDIDNLQSIKDRNWQDTTRNQNRVEDMSTTPPTLVVRDMVSGMAVRPGGADNVIINEGVIFQESAILPPVPGTFDSTYRWARETGGTLLTAPAPGGPEYYLLEAQMQEVTTSTVNRDIFSPGTGVFVPTPVPKVIEREVNYQFIAGTAGQAPAPTAGWVPLAVIFRPGGATNVVQDEIADVRPMTEDRDQNGMSTSRGRQLRVESLASARSNLIDLRMEEEANGHIYKANVLQMDPTSAQVLQPGVALIADTWFYLYAFTWNDLHPRFWYANGKQATCGFVLSDVAPNPGDRSPSAPIPAVPAPWNFAGADNFRMVAALRRDGTNSGWMWCHSDGDNKFLIERDTSMQITQNPIAAATPYAIDFIAGGQSPASAIHTKCQGSYSGDVGTGATADIIVYRETGGGGSGYYSFQQSTEDANMHVVEIPDCEFQTAFGDAGLGLWEVVGWTER